MRDGLCVLSNGAGDTIAEGYFRDGRRFGGWVLWEKKTVRQEFWSGGDEPDSTTAALPPWEILLLDVTARWPAGDSGGWDLGSYSWSQEPAGDDSTMVVHQSEIEMGVPPASLYRVRRDMGILLVHKSAHGRGDFETVLKPYFVGTRGKAYSLRHLYRN